MERKFKHKLTNKVIKIGGKTGLSCQTLIGNSNLILGDIIKGEDWEEVVEKDYEILEVKGKYGAVSSYIEILDSDLKDKTIFKIKRLSDGEIFTIGDLVKCEECKGKITSLEIYGNDIYLKGLHNNMRFGYTLCKALDCDEIPQKVKQPLFTTEDGVDIFEGDNLYSIDNMLNIKKHLLFNARYDDNTLLNNRIFFNSDYKHFSTKEKAEEYILYNKPVLSLKEIKETTTIKGLSLKKLEKLVQQKLKS